MSILALDHVNIRSRDPKATLAFFREVLLMKVAGPMGMQKGDRLQVGNTVLEVR